MLAKTMRRSTSDGIFPTAQLPVPRKRVAAEDRSTARSDAIHVEDVRRWCRRDRRRCREHLRRTIRDVQGGTGVEGTRISRTLGKLLGT